MLNLTTQINDLVILTKDDGTSFNLYDLSLTELDSLICDDESKGHRQTILDAYNKKLSELAYRVLDI